MISEYTLDVGADHLRIDSGEITAVWIEGLRRPTQLVQVEDIWRDKPPFADTLGMRGVPNRYVRRGNVIHFYPASIHRWRLLVEYKDG